MDLITSTLILLALFGPSLQQSDVYNNLVDHLLEQYYAPDWITLPDTSNKLSFLGGRLDLQQGYLLGLPSISRIMDVGVTKGQPYDMVVVDIQFSDVQVIYDSYTVKGSIFSNVFSSGHANATDEKVNVRVNFLIGKSICNIKIDKLEFIDKQDFNVKLIPSCKSCSPISDSIFKSVRRIFNSTVKDVVKREMIDQLELMVKKFKADCF